MVRNSILNGEEFVIFVTEVELIMNDRPITKVSSDVKDLIALISNAL